MAEHLYRVKSVPTTCTEYVENAEIPLEVDEPPPARIDIEEGDCAGVYFELVE